MLTQLHIKNLIIVAELQLQLNAGMTALTGETGAGKSILMDALALTLGERADPKMIRNGCDDAEISAHFDLSGCDQARQWLETQGLATAEQCVIRRVLSQHKRSRAYINGHTVSSTQLRTLGDYLVDIHGQHAHQSLLHAPAQRMRLDAYGGHTELVEQVAHCYRRWRTLDERWRQLVHVQSERAARLELVRMQVEELDALALAADELDQLDSEQRRLAHLDQLQTTAARLVQWLYEGDAALHEQVGQATSELSALLEHDSKLGTFVELLEGAGVQLEEAAFGLRQYLDGLELDPERLATVEARLEHIHDIARKYRMLPNQLRDHLAGLERELEQLEQTGTDLEALDRERNMALQQYIEDTAQLSQARHQAAIELSRIVTEDMHQLGMDGGQFAIDLVTQDIEHGTAHGCDQITFLVSANPGQPLQPLSRVASGGELSRISLALQVATISGGTIPTLVFDEVDVGIGGSIAETVGHRLRRLGDDRQILCITHLPQVAAQAHQQLRVSKYTKSGMTLTAIKMLDQEQRIEEIARMLGGAEITATTRAHAREMLSIATPLAATQPKMALYES